MAGLSVDPGFVADLKNKYRNLQDQKDEAERLATEAANALWKFMDDHAYRQAVKPYEICGAEDAWHPRLEESDPAYDEDALIPEAQCQLPKGHREMGYHNHLECKPDGSVWGAWS